MKIRLTDRVCILNFKNDFEKKLMNKFLTYKDTSKCFTGGKYDPMKEQNVHFLKESSKAPGNFVCFAGFCKEIMLKAKDSGIEIEDFEDNRTHFDFQKKAWTHDELRELFDPNFKYVEHQIRTLQAMQKTNTALCVLPTSAGKSYIMAAFMKKTGLRTLVLNDRATLAMQLAEDFKKYGLDCGSCCGKGMREGYNMVSTIQSVKKIPFLNEFDCVITDECFPGNEKVLTEDGLEWISKLVLSKSTKKVWSFNTSTKKMELKPIINWFKKETEFDKFIKLTIGRNKIVSTPNHKYYIYNNGIIEKKEASNIDIGDKIITFANDPTMLETTPIINKFQKSVLIGTVLGDAYLANVNNRLSRIRFTHGEKQLEYLKYKQHIFRNLFGNVEPYYNFSGYNRNKKIYFVSSKSSEELFEYYNKFYKNGKKIIYNIIDEIDEISLAFWIMDDGNLQKHKAKIESCHYALATHSFSEEENDILIEMFNNKFGLDPKKKFDKRCNKYFLVFPTKDTKKISKIISKYVHPSMNYKLLEQDKNNFVENKEELYNFGYKTVSKKEEVKPKYKPVYNITVEDNHNYIIGEGAKVLVSNCHRASSNTFQEFLSAFGCPLKYGFSASPNNGNFLNYAKIRQFFGSPCIDVSSSELVENEVMAKPIIKLIEVNHAETINYPSAYDELVHNEDRNNAIAKIASMYEDGVAILITHIEHGEILQEKIPGLVFIKGETPLVERMKILKDFNEGKIKKIVGSNILNEGISITNMKVLIMASGNKGLAQTTQKIGRVLRISKDKKEGIFYDFIDKGNDFLLKHSKERVKIYKKNGFNDITVYDKDLNIKA